MLKPKHTQSSLSDVQQRVLGLVTIGEGMMRLVFGARTPAWKLSYIKKTLGKNA